VQTVDDCIAKYSELCRVAFTPMSKSVSKFDHVVLEDIFKRVIRESPLALEPDAPLRDHGGCKTFVVAIKLRGAGSIASIMRSYDTATADASTALIWQAARATSAAPTFFDPITIDGVEYGDGGTGWNNPAAEAITEARNIWSNRPLGCLLSLGTGLEDANQLSGNNDTKPEGASRFLHRFSPRTAFRIKVAEYCVSSLTSCEKTHQDISTKYAGQIVLNRTYFRFNVPQGLSATRLEEWEKIGDIVSLTEDYMQTGEVLENKQAVARVLLKPDLASLGRLSFNNLCI